jgi:hypothetical protein
LNLESFLLGFSIGDSGQRRPQQGHWRPPQQGHGRPLQQGHRRQGQRQCCRKEINFFCAFLCSTFWCSNIIPFNKCLLTEQMFFLNEWLNMSLLSAFNISVIRYWHIGKVDWTGSTIILDDVQNDLKGKYFRCLLTFTSVRNDKKGSSN